MPSSRVRNKCNPEAIIHRLSISEMCANLTDKLNSFHREICHDVTRFFMSDDVK